MSVVLAAERITDAEKHQQLLADHGLPSLS
jgi:hypothetical protein